MEALHDSCGALRSYEESVSIRQWLVAADPGNTRWQDELAIAGGRLATLRSRAMRAHLSEDSEPLRAVR
jgi:hypothetical protein